MIKIYQISTNYCTYLKKTPLWLYHVLSRNIINIILHDINVFVLLMIIVLQIYYNWSN